MQEKRRSKRLPAQLVLSVSRLFKQNTAADIDVTAPIYVQDISKLGIGFVSEGDFPVGYYFNARLELGGEDCTLYCVVQIVRKNELEDGRSSYGCEFVGMAPVLGYIFDEYERKIEEAGASV